MDAMVEAICTEIEIKSKDYNHPIETIYFGGGTPSVLSTHQIEQILETIQQHYSTPFATEITIEVNPDDLSPSYLDDICTLGVNRLSIGVQSFDASHLKWMNRSHTAEQALNSIVWAKEKGFHTSSIDLIYGFDGLTMDQWKENVSIALHSGLHHISCYALTIEDNTPFAKIQAKQQMPLVHDFNAWEQFKYIHEKATEMGWRHYELSNFAKEGHKSKHNQAYWSSRPYLGIGPGAHGYDGNKLRSWNISDNWKYIDLIKSKGNSFQTTEILTDIEQENEQIMVGLRTAEGIPLELIKSSLDNSQHPIHPFLSQNLAIIEGDKLKLTMEGWWQSDHIIGTLFQV